MNMINIIKDLINMPRSITGEPIRKTIKYIKNKIPELEIMRFKSGKKAAQIQKRQTVKQSRRTRIKRKSTS